MPKCAVDYYFKSRDTRSKYTFWNRKDLVLCAVGGAGKMSVMEFHSIELFSLLSLSQMVNYMLASMLTLWEQTPPFSVLWGQRLPCEQISITPDGWMVNVLYICRDFILCRLYSFHAPLFNMQSKHCSKCWNVKIVVFIFIHQVINRNSERL